MSALADVSPSGGLSDDLARERARLGLANTPVSGSTRTTARILRTTVFSFYNNILFVIAIALLALGRYSDALVSVGLGLINAVLAAFQELRARRALDRLQLLAREPVTVVRDGTDRQVSPAEVVQGDLLRIRPGDQIVVDGPVAGIAGARELEMDESLLTGESDPVVKAVGDPLLSGSSCVGGEALQRADAVGAESHAGRLTTAARADTTSTTPLQRRIELAVRVVIVLVVLMSGAILAQALLDGSTVLRFVQTSAVLSGLVPYGLFFLIAVAYAVGSARLAGCGALVQRTNAVEAISRVDVVCTDKTGTLTTGRLALAEIAVATAGDRDAEAARELLGTLARSVTAPNTTTAALAADTSLPGDATMLIDEIPFRSALRWSGVTSTTAASGTASGDFPELRSIVLGAPATLRPALTDPPSVLEDLAAKARVFTDDGLRVLLLATADARLRDAEERPVLPPLRAVALVALADELRDGVRDVIAGLTAEQVAVKVISGDDPDTVAALARRAGLTGPAISGPELAAFARLIPETWSPQPGAPSEQDAAGPGETFDEAVDTHTVFGRVAPDQKEQIAASLSRRGHHVAMVGDGVNDAQALKRAQVGVAMRSSNAVTRDVADIVFLDDSFATLPPARTEGRRIITGVGSSMFLFMARVMTQMVVILTVTLLGLGFPYTPTQVGLTLFTVGLPTLFLTMWARPQPPPRRCSTRSAVLRRPAGSAIGPLIVVQTVMAVSIVVTTLVEAVLLRRRPSPLRWAASA